ncbi:hypothetical protein [Adhaeribacter aquaticus]|uniref:hypothetical protein n=1 Tax=Adhaeribacter aquaticus TaxID=299567 RepID=UPI00041E2911|nr:hypothetical protein [Adhaeribacter aquaticus]
MKNIASYKTFLVAALAVLSLSFMSCEKEEEMVVDRVVSPVLVVTNGSTFLPGEAVNVSATFYELDKSGILNHAVGIDSIPVSNLAVTVRLNNNVIASITTDQKGKAILSKTWSELGVATPKAGNAVSLEWSGSVKGQGFAKLMRVSVK